MLRQRRWRQKQHALNSRSNTRVISNCGALGLPQSSCARYRCQCVEHPSNYCSHHAIYGLPRWKRCDRLWTDQRHYERAEAVVTVATNRYSILRTQKFNRKDTLLCKLLIFLKSTTDLFYLKKYLTYILKKC